MNIVVLSGRITKEPELKQTQSGYQVTSFSLAVRRDKDVTDFIDCVAWRNTAEFICKYFHKGDWLEVNGSIQTRTYTDKNGESRKAKEVIISQVYFGGGKSKDSDNHSSKNPQEKELKNQNKGNDSNEKNAVESYGQGSFDEYMDIQNEEGDLPF